MYFLTFGNPFTDTDPLLQNRESQCSPLWFNTDENQASWSFFKILERYTFKNTNSRLGGGGACPNPSTSQAEAGGSL